MKVVKLLMCVVAVVLAAPAFAGGEGWTSDFEAAKKQAAKEGKDLLVDFTGSDWCGWCIKLNKEVFQHDAFKTGVKDTFVLVEIDFPKDKSKLSEQTQKQNKQLGEQYAVSGYPTILLCDAQGRPYAKTGYQEGGPEKYVAHLNELRELKAKRDEALAKADKAKGVEKAKGLLAALQAMGLDDGVAESFYGDILKQIPALDPQDETGFVKQQAIKKRLEVFESKMQEYFEQQDMDGALVYIDSVIKEGGFDTEQTQQLMMARVMVLMQQEKFDEALKAVDAAVKYAPDSPLNERIQMFREKMV